MNHVQQQPLLSIITVTKNCVATIERTLRSVQAVKAMNVEYIVIDGVSTDGTLAVIGAVDGLVDKLISEPDSGIYNAMNKGVTQASGRYILFINGDDALVPETFLQVQKILADTKADIVCCRSFVELNDEIIETLVPHPNYLFFHNSIPHPSTFVRVAVLKKYMFREDLKIAADYDLFLRLRLARKKFVTLNLPIAIHRRGGTSGNRALSHEEVEKVKSDNLGLSYHLVSTLQKLYRMGKKVLPGWALPHP